MNEKIKHIEEKYIYRMADSVYIKIDIAKNYYNQKEISYKNWIFHRDMEKMVKFLGKL